MRFVCRHRRHFQGSWVENVNLFREGGAENSTRTAGANILGRGSGNMCEDCGMVSKNYGMADEQLRRWCGECGRVHGAVLLSKYNQMGETAYNEMMASRLE